MAQDHDIASMFLSIRAHLARAVMGIVPPKDIEDIVQETYVRVCQADIRDPIREPRSFLFKTVRNLALDHIKKAESRLTISVEDESLNGFGECQECGDETLERVSSHEEFSIFCDAVRRLPVQCRRIFVLKKVYGYSQREIANELGISESTVEKHVAMGIKRCAFFMMRQRKANNRTDKKRTNVSRQGGGA